MTTTAHASGRGVRPALITDVGMSREDEYTARRRRYGALMAGRVVCVVMAFVVGSVFSNIWLAGLFIAGAAVLPWAAVLIANDRLPLTPAARRTSTPSPAPPQLDAGTGSSDATAHQVIDG